MGVAVAVCAFGLGAASSASAAPAGPDLPSDGPTCAAPALTTGENTPVSESSDCTDSTGTATSYEIVDPASNGTASVDPSGNLTYAPNSGYYGSDAFTFQVTDSNAATSQETVSVTVSQGPSCAGLPLTTGENTVGSVGPSCTDPDGGTMTYAVASQPADGSATVSNGQLVYTPAAGYYGNDSFTYTATSADGTSQPETVNVSVAQGPSCLPVSLTTGENTVGPVAPNCTEPNGEPMTYAVASQPADGSATVSNGQLVYTPAAGYYGSDSFAYTATSADGTSQPETADVTVTQGPSCQPASLATGENTAGAAAANCSSAPTAYAIVAQPGNGSATIGSNGAISYTPDPGYTGTDSFTYDATSNDGTSQPATVSVTVSQGPACSPGSLTVWESGTGSMAPICTEPNHETMTYAVASPPADGTTTVSGGQLTYTPNPGYTGTDSFTYDATSNDGTSQPATVSVTVEGPPTISIATPVNGESYYWQSIPASAFSCASGTDGMLESCNATVDGSAPFASGTTLPDSLGTHTVTVTATDTDGQTTTQTATYTSSLTALPLVSLTAPRSEASYTLDQTVKASYACLPAKNGPSITARKGTVAPTKAINTSTIGKHTFTVTATDATGQSASVKVVYDVVATTNRFTVNRAAAGRRGLVALQLRLPGPGKLSVVASGWDRSRGGAQTAFDKRFVYASASGRVNAGGGERLSISPGRRGRALVALAGAIPVVQVAIIYTPTGGKPRELRTRQIVLR